MILFQENWQKEVRDYLQPLLVYFHSTCGIYKVQVIEKQQSYENINGHWGEFIIAEGRVHHLSTPSYGGSHDDSASITWGLKSDFPSPLHFWAAATLVINAFELEQSLKPAESIFFYSQEFSAVTPFNNPNLAEFANKHWPNDWHPMKGSPSYTPNIEVLGKHDWAKNQPPLPAIVNDKALRSWLIQPKWNDEWTLFETGNHFILWNWQTGA